MGKAVIRRAEPGDAPFLARIMLISGRAHVERGIWEVVLGRPEQGVLDFLRRVAVTGPAHLFHYSCFLTAEEDGAPVAGLGGYDPAVKGYDKLRQAVESVRRAEGSTPRDPETEERAQRVLSCLPDQIDGAWVIDSVATLPEFRRRGISEKLLSRILEAGSDLGHSKAQVNIYIGNDPARKAYEKMGFSVVEEKRCTSFMEEIGSPGMMSMAVSLKAG